MMEDDDDWQEMPVIQSSNKANKLEIERQWRLAREENGEDPDEPAEGEEQLSDASSSDDGIAGRRRKQHKKPGKLAQRSVAVPSNPRLGAVAGSGSNTSQQLSPLTPKTPMGQTTGAHLGYDDEGAEWREKRDVDEQDYTRLELDEDPEEDEVHTRTQYLFDDDKGMTPLSQMQTTKTMLSDPQRIAYVGLCRLVTREMAIAFKGVKELQPATESIQNWGTKVMGRLYQHMEIDPAEQRMIEQLAEHGVTSSDLVPSLITTHTVPNPQYDPEAEKEAQEEAEREALEAAEEAAREAEVAVERNEREKEDVHLADPAGDFTLREAASNRAGAPPYELTQASQPRDSSVSPPSDDGSKLSRKSTSSDDEDAPPQYDALPKTSKTPKTGTPLSPKRPEVPSEADIGNDDKVDSEETADTSKNLVQPLPNTLPGVTTNLTAADKTVTLDIRWTVLCDLFLALVADSVYDARSRVLLGRMAVHLGLSWTDVIRFERRLTDALEIQEGIKNKDNAGVLDQRANADKRRRYLLMGLATVGGGLVLGLSAGILAPAIAGGLAGALATMGVSGAGAVITGAGSAAVITTGGVLTGSSIGVRGMARRTKAVTQFELHPVHNNKRLNVIIAVPGFMNGPQDDVRLPFSTVDPVMGDLFSILWESKTLGQTGNALKILGSEVLSSVGQQVLQMTLLGAMMSALQWPILLTKLGYLIDNPWSNALDRARQAGEVLAAILIERGLGVRPVTLVGFSLGARVIFYTLVALAKKKAFGIVQEVYLMGATVTASRKTWREVRGVVAGRFVNCYAQNDWILGYLFRATTGGLSTVAGLRPVEFIPDLENVDITELVAGHMSYRSLMPLILKQVGFRVTADSFDEPDELEKPDREVLTPEEELARLQAQKKASWLSRWKKDKSTPATPVDSRRPSESSAVEEAARKSLDSNRMYEPYDAEVPEKEVSKLSEETKDVVTDIVHDRTEKEGALPSPVNQVTTAEEEETESVKKGEADAAAPKDKGVGFDLDKIREAIASDDGTGQLPMRDINTASRSSNGQRSSADEVRPATPSNAPKGKTLFGRLRSKPDLARTGSAPPPSSGGLVLPNGQSAEQLRYEAQQRMLEEQEAREEEAFKKGLPVSQMYPASDNPFASSTASLPGVNSTKSGTINDLHGFGNAGQQGVGLSFGGLDGSISFASSDRDDEWHSTSTDNGTAWKDPWQTDNSSSWAGTSKW